jgi:hypothetical protein
VCIRLRPEHRNHVWSYDFVEDRTHDGGKYRMLNVLADFTHECMSLTSRRTVMARKRYKLPEEIVAKLRQVDVLVSQGQNMVGLAIDNLAERARLAQSSSQGRLRL